MIDDSLIADLAKKGLVWKDGIKLDVKSGEEPKSKSKSKSKK